MEHIIQMDRLVGRGNGFLKFFQRSFVRCFGPVVPGMKKVSIGSSLDSHVKCVEDPGNVHCDHTAKQLGRTGHLVVTELAICLRSALTTLIPQSF